MNASSSPLANSQHSATILIVEDDDDLAQLIQMHIKFQGHNTLRVASCADARQAYAAQHCDLVVLDRGLPDGDGISLCQQFRQHDDWVPVLVLRAKGAEMEKVEGLEAGVDDYLTKPFSVLEFQARVRNMLRRSHRSQPADKPQSTMQFGELKISPELHTVCLGGKAIALTATELSLLHFLAQRPGRVFNKDELLQHVWETDHAGYHHTGCSTVNRLRRKLNQPQRPKQQQLIQTVWGVGYKFEPQ